MTANSGITEQKDSESPKVYVRSPYEAPNLLDFVDGDISDIFVGKLYKTDLIIQAQMIKEMRTLNSILAEIVKKV